MAPDPAGRALGLAKGTAHGIIRTLRRRWASSTRTRESSLYDVGRGLLRAGVGPPRSQRAAVAGAELVRRAGRAHRRGRPGGRLRRRRGRDRAPRLPAGRQRPEPADRLPPGAARDRPRQDPAGLRPAGRARGSPGSAMESLTYRTITDRSRLLRDLADVRDQGWAARSRRPSPGPRASPRPSATRRLRHRRGGDPGPGRGHLRRQVASPDRLTKHVVNAGQVDLARARPRPGPVSETLRRGAGPGHHLDPLRALRPSRPDGRGRPAGARPALPADPGGWSTTPRRSGRWCAG